MNKYLSNKSIGTKKKRRKLKAELGWGEVAAANPSEGNSLFIQIKTSQGRDHNFKIVSGTRQ